MPEHTINLRACAPNGGWKENTYYVVAVKMNARNPEHRAIMHSGFLNGPGGGPGSYRSLWQATYDDPMDPAGVFSLRVICEIADMGRKS